MDNLLHFLFWAVVEGLFFRIGRGLLKVLSLGKIKLENPTPFQVFVVATFGLAVGLPIAIVFARFFLVLIG